MTRFGNLGVSIETGHPVVDRTIDGFFRVGAVSIFTCPKNPSISYASLVPLKDFDFFFFVGVLFFLRLLPLDKSVKMHITWLRVVCSFSIFLFINFFCNF